MLEYLERKTTFGFQAVSKPLAPAALICKSYMNQNNQISKKVIGPHFLKLDLMFCASPTPLIKSGKSFYKLIISI